MLTAPLWSRLDAARTLAAGWVIFWMWRGSVRLRYAQMTLWGRALRR